MKTVSGEAHSSKSISLSKAASTLSTFISTENGASQALCAYLRRASDSFNELKQLHKELGLSRSDVMLRRPKSGDISGRGFVGDNPSRSAVSQEFNHGDDSEFRKRRDDSGIKTSSTERLAQIVESSQKQDHGVQHNAAMGREGQTHKKRKRSKSGFNDLEVQKDHSGGIVDQERNETEAQDKENKKNDYRVVQENMLSNSMEHLPNKKKKMEHRAAEI